MHGATTTDTIDARCYHDSYFLLVYENFLLVGMLLNFKSRIYSVNASK